jgi:hypothetical protein
MHLDMLEDGNGFSEKPFFWRDIELVKPENLHYNFPGDHIFNYYKNQV